MEQEGSLDFLVLPVVEEEVDNMLVLLTDLDEVLGRREASNKEVEYMCDVDAVVLKVSLKDGFCT